MADTITPIRVFISSPGDLVPERALVHALLDELNRSPVFRDRYKLIPYAWEAGTPPVIGAHAQDTVDSYLLHPADADILICLLWLRMGSPQQRIDPETNQPYQSGTEYEFLTAYRACQTRGRPLILLYRCVRASQDTITLDREQAERVDAFFKRFQLGGDLQGLTGSFDDLDSLRDKLRHDLSLLLHRDFAPLPVLHTDTTIPADRNRRRMLEKVRQFWIDGILEQSLGGATHLELALTYHTHAIYDPWQHMIQPPEQGANAVAPGTSIAQIYDSLGGALLILGGAGVGKTTTLLELARTLIARAEQDHTLAMPVVFNLSSWAVRRRPLEEWLVDELSARYQVPRRIGQAWVEADQVLPLFDGLDEVAAEHRSACVAALNQFRARHWLLDFVVCSREADYAALSTKLQVQGAVVVQSLTAAQVDAYLDQAGDQLAAVRTLLQEDPMLRELADTPLMLSIMVLAYRGMPIDELRAYGSLDEQRRHVFDTYIQRMLARRGASARYSPQQTLNWLTWLARSMAQHSQTLFFIEELQPDWLTPVAQRRHYALGIGIVIGLAQALLSGFSAAFVFGLLGEQLYGLSVGLFYGLLGGFMRGFVSGLVFGLISGITVHYHQAHAARYPSKWRRVASTLGLGLVVGLVVGLLGGMVGGSLV